MKYDGRTFWMSEQFGFYAMAFLCVLFVPCVPALAAPSAAKEQQSESAGKAHEASTADSAEVEASGEQAESQAAKHADAEKNGKRAEPAPDDTEAPAKEAKSAEAREREKVRLAQFMLQGSLPESAGEMALFGDLQTDLRKLIDRIDKAAGDTSIKGAVLTIQNPAIGLGRIEELRAAVQRFRSAGKKIHAQLEMATPADYLVACACDEIIIPESGMIMLPGIHSEATFFKGMLGKLGIVADFMHIGPYKGAAEPLMRDKYSPEVRENLTSVINDTYDQLVTTIAADRLLTVEKVQEQVDRGLITASGALDAGLVDRLEYPDTLRQGLAKQYSADPLVYVRNYGKEDVDTDFSGPMGFVKLLQLMAGVKPGSGGASTKKVAVVYAVGPIMTGESERDPFGGQVMGSTTIVEALREANKDDQVVAIVLRIDSPGGSAIASDLIWRETRRIEKPIVASMGDVAGSGGYYIAMGADRIYAAPGTITGSIGVVSGKFAYRGLYDKIGVTTETIHRGKNSGIFGGSGRFSDSERQVMKEFMEDIYGQFTRKAADGRAMPLKKLQSLAGGRIYTGRQAKRNGLVDELGSLEDAVVAAKQLAGLEKDDKVRIRVLPEPINFLESMFGGTDSEEEVRLPVGMAGLPTELTTPLRQVHLLRRLCREPAMLLMPVEIHME